MGIVTAATSHSPPAPPPEADQRVFLHGVSWDDYDRLLAIRGDVAGPRLTYLEGEMELICPSSKHETLKKMIGRLVEAFAEERGLDLNGVGSWTLRRAPRERGLEPDECYVLGPLAGREVPDLAIEVDWTSGGIDRLDVYRGLGVPEVWTWKAGGIAVQRLRGDTYATAPRSVLLPDLDLALLASFIERPDQTAAVREFRAALARNR